MRTPTPANDNRPQWFDDLLLAHDPYIRTRIAALEKNSAKHDDIYQDVVLHALANWQSYRRNGNFAGWLYWAIYDAARPRRKIVETCSTSDGVSPPTQEHVVGITQSLQKLSPKQSEAMVLYICGHTKAEIGRRFCVSTPAIIGRLNDARARLVAANDNEKKNAAA